VSAVARAGGEPVVVVTGGNRGIGFEICRQLAARGARVVLTARNAEAGAAAVKKLAAQKLAVTFHPLDVTDAKSVAALRDFLQETYGHVDVLTNNAGIIAKGDAPALKVELAAVRETVETNALGPLHLAQTLVPLLKKGTSPRIVNMSSGMGALTDNDGGYAAYRMSKTAINAVTAILSAELRGAIAVNSVCPGWVKTDMGGPHATRDVADGADTAVWLALDAPEKLTGKILSLPGGCNLHLACAPGLFRLISQRNFHGRAATFAAHGRSRHLAVAVPPTGDR
jgi:NAD(P)-dependent dehydrogenase (short-subunit alcohol dehydrogenase family)